MDQSKAAKPVIQTYVQAFHPDWKPNSKAFKAECSKLFKYILYCEHRYLWVLESPKHAEEFEKRRAMGPAAYWLSHYDESE